MSAHTACRLIASFVFFFCATVHAQVKEGNVYLPQVPPAKNSVCRIFSVWQPTAKFLQCNPRFPEDGSYTLSGKYIKKRKLFRSLAQRPVYTDFGSDMYPAVSALPAGPVSTGGNICVQLLHTDSSCMLFPMDCPETEFVSSNAYAGYSPSLKKAYGKLNNYYRQQAAALIVPRFTGPVHIADLGDPVADSASNKPGDLYFQFECVDVHSVNDHYLSAELALFFPVPMLTFFFPWNYPLIFVRKHEGSRYPSNLLMALHVKDNEGREIKTYRQAIFVKEKHMIMMVGQHNIKTRSLLMRQAAPVAMQNLVNQFAADTATQRRIRERDTQVKDIAAGNDQLTGYISMQARMAQLALQERTLAMALQELRGKMKVFMMLKGQPAGNISTATNTSASPGANAAALGAALAFDAVATALMNGSYNKQLRILSAEYHRLATAYEQITDEENKLSAAIATSAQNPQLAMLQAADHY